MLQQILTQNLGLSEKEAATYTAILELGDSTVLPIAKKAGVKRTSVYHIINHLVEIGLVDMALVRNRKHFKARSPQYLESLQEQRLQEIKEAIPEFMSLYNTSVTKPKISYFEGPEQVRQIMLEELHHKTIRSIWPMREVVEMIGGEQFMAKLAAGVKERGSRVKVIRFPHQEVQYTGWQNTPRETWREIRYAKPGTIFPIAIQIYDENMVAFISSKNEGFGIMIESLELTQAMTFMFEMFWEQTVAS